MGPNGLNSLMQEFTRVVWVIVILRIQYLYFMQEFIWMHCLELTSLWSCELQGWQSAKLTRCIEAMAQWSLNICWNSLLSHKKDFDLIWFEMVMWEIIFIAIRLNLMFCTSLKHWNTLQKLTSNVKRKNKSLAISKEPIHRQRNRKNGIGGPRKTRFVREQFKYYQENFSAPHLWATKNNEIM